jgi:hypothetical protein
MPEVLTFYGTIGNGIESASLEVEPHKSNAFSLEDAPSVMAVSCSDTAMEEGKWGVL